VVQLNRLEPLPSILHRLAPVHVECVWVSELLLQVENDALGLVLEFDLLVVFASGQAFVSLMQGRVAVFAFDIDSRTDLNELVHDVHFVGTDCVLERSVAVLVLTIHVRFRLLVHFVPKFGLSFLVLEQLLLFRADGRLVFALVALDHFTGHALAVRVLDLGVNTLFDAMVVDFLANVFHFVDLVDRERLAVIIVVLQLNQAHEQLHLFLVQV